MAGNLFVGFAAVFFGAEEAYGCFTCNEFNQSSTFYKKTISYPICGINYDVKECKSKEFHCSNCANLINVLNIDVCINHAPWIKYKCIAYIPAHDKLRLDILSIQQQPLVCATTAFTYTTNDASLEGLAV